MPILVCPLLCLTVVPLCSVAADVARKEYELRQATWPKSVPK